MAQPLLRGLRRVPPLLARSEGAGRGGAAATFFWAHTSVPPPERVLTALSWMLSLNRGMFVRLSDGWPAVHRPSSFWEFRTSENPPRRGVCGCQSPCLCANCGAAPPFCILGCSRRCGRCTHLRERGEKKKNRLFSAGGVSGWSSSRFSRRNKDVVCTREVFVGYIHLTVRLRWCALENSSSFSYGLSVRHGVHNMTRAGVRETGCLRRRKKAARKHQRTDILRMYT